MKNLFSCFALLLVLVASSFTLSTSESVLPAQVDYFLKLDGIDGECTAAGHGGWIELESVSFNKATKTIKIVRPKTSKSSPLLQLACAQGQHFRTATLHQRAGGGNMHDYYKVTMEDVLVSSYQTSGTAAKPLETLTLGYTKAVFPN